MCSIAQRMHGKCLLQATVGSQLFWFARNQSRHGQRPEAALAHEAAMASSGTGRREEAPEE